MHTGDFGTSEECIAWRTSGKMPYHQYLNYLKIVPVNENGFLFKAMLYYKHVPPYDLGPDRWAFLTIHDLRSIKPFSEFRERNKPFYITFGQSFYEVKDIQPNEAGVLELVLQHAGQSSLN